MNNKIVSYGASLLMLAVAIYVASLAWKAGQKPAVETEPKTKHHLAGYVVALLMLFVAIWVASKAWKAGQTPAVAVAP